MREQMRHGTRPGVTFAVILIFLALIGFTATGAEIIGRLLGLEEALMTRGQLPTDDLVLAYAVFIGLLGLWAGIGGSQPQGEDSWGGAVVGGLSAGLVTGLIFGVFIVIFGSIAFAGVDMRPYLAAMSLKAVALLTLGQAPLVGALLTIALLTGVALLGALLARALRVSAWRGRLGRLWERFGTWTSGLPLQAQVRRSGMGRYILWAILLAAILVLASLGVATAILVGAALSFLGVGASPPTPEWGIMLSDGRPYMRSAWWIMAYPGLAITVTVLGANLVGDGLRDALDPRMGSH